MNFDSINNNNYSTILFAIIIFSYVFALERVELPDFLKHLFNNNIFRVVFLSLLLVYTFDKAPYVALFIAFVFVVTLEYLNQAEIIENISYLES